MDTSQWMLSVISLGSLSSLKSFGLMVKAQLESKYHLMTFQNSIGAGNVLSLVNCTCNHEELPELFDVKLQEI